MNPRGPPGTPMDIETFPQNSQIKSMEQTPLQSLTYLWKIMRKRSGKFFFFLFFFKRLDFSENLARVSSVFRTFPNLQNLRKHLKILLIFQIFNFLVWTPRPQLIQNNIYIYTFIHFNHQNIPSFFNSMHFFFFKKIGFEPNLSRPPTYLVH